MRSEVFVKRKYSNAVIFLSGTGSNAEKLLSSPRYGISWRCCALVTDRSTSRARELAEQHDLPLIEVDIFRFYARRTAETDCAVSSGFRSSGRFYSADQSGCGLSMPEHSSGRSDSSSKRKTLPDRSA